MLVWLDLETIKSRQGGSEELLVGCNYEIRRDGYPSFETNRDKASRLLGGLYPRSEDGPFWEWDGAILYSKPLGIRLGHSGHADWSKSPENRDMRHLKGGK